MGRGRGGGGRNARGRSGVRNVGGQRAALNNLNNLAVGNTMDVLQDFNGRSSILRITRTGNNTFDISAVDNSDGEYRGRVINTLRDRSLTDAQLGIQRG